MNILITGSNGLLGKELCHYLAPAHVIFTLVRNHQQCCERAFYWNPEQGELDESALTGIEAVIHLAAEPIADGRWNPAKKQRILNSRVKGTALLARAIANHPNPPQVFISASAIGYYGNKGPLSLTEESPPGNDFLAEVCQQWEVASHIDGHPEIRRVQLRIGVVLTPKGGALAKMLPPFRLGLGGPLGHGQQYLSWITLNDTMRAIEYCLITPHIRGPVNLVSPHPITNAEFSKTLAHTLQRPAWFNVPAPILRLLAGELADLALLSSTRVEPTKLIANGFVFHAPQLAPALAGLVGL